MSVYPRKGAGHRAYTGTRLESCGICPRIENKHFKKSRGTCSQPCEICCPHHSSLKNICKEFLLRIPSNPFQILFYSQLKKTIENKRNPQGTLNPLLSRPDFCGMSNRWRWWWGGSGRWFVRSVDHSSASNLLKDTVLNYYYIIFLQ